MNTLAAVGVVVVVAGMLVVAAPRLRPPLREYQPSRGWYQYPASKRRLPFQLTPDAWLFV